MIVFCAFLSIRMNVNYTDKFYDLRCILLLVPGYYRLDTAGMLQRAGRNAKDLKSSRPRWAAAIATDHEGKVRLVLH
jgi:hypothetical protein